MVAVNAPVLVKADQISDLKAKIQQLTNQLKALQSSNVSATSRVAIGYCKNVKFNRTLEIGSTGNDVKCLQQIVENAVTGTYGPLTSAKVKTFQAKKGLSATGEVGPITMSALNTEVDIIAKNQPLAIPLSAPVDCSSVTQFGITWYFSTSKTCGQYANGDWWVLGPVSITRITPESRTVNGWTNNGTMVNPLGNGQGFDSSSYKYAPYYSFANVSPSFTGSPLNLNSGSVVSVISLDSANPQQANPSLAEHRPQWTTEAVLTVVASTPASGDFRPPVSGTDKTSHWNKDQLRYDILKSYAPVASTPDLATVESYFEMPWYAQSEGPAEQYMSPTNNMPNYGREQAQQVSDAILSLQLNYSPEQKETLYIRLVQYGIDIYGSVKNGLIFTSGGSLNSGRKTPLVLAGLALNDSNILEWADASKHKVFLEDLQTFYVDQYETTIGHPAHAYGGTKVFQPWQLVNIEDVAHMGATCGNYGTGSVGDGRPRTAYSSWQVDPITGKTYPNGIPEWGEQHDRAINNDGSNWDAYYRWAGGADLGNGLGISLTDGGRAAWNYPAFFDYEDRYWAIESANGVNGQSFNPAPITPFAFEMWAAYSGGAPIVGHPPVISGSSSITVNEDSTAGVSGTVVATDPDVGDVLTYYALSGAKGAVSINLTTGAFNYKPNANAFGSDSFTVTVKDNNNNSASKTISVTITPMPDAPTAASISATAVVNTPQAITLLGNDVDGDALTYSIITMPIHGTALMSGGTLIYTPAGGYLGSDNISYKATDSTGLVSNIAQIIVTVSSAPSSLVYSDSNVRNFAGQDDNGIDISGAVSNVTSQITASIWVKRGVLASGQYSTLIADETYPAQKGFFLGDLSTIGPNDPYCFRVDASNTATCESSATTNGTWVNYTGVYNGTTIALHKIYKSSTTGLIVDDKTSKAFTKAFATNTGDVNIGGGVLGNTANLMLFNAALTDSQIMAMAGQPPAENIAPLAINQSVPSFPANTIKLITLMATDAESNPLTYKIASHPMHGAVVLSGNRATYTPTTDYSGTDNFAFQANDGKLDSNVAVVYLTITASNNGSCEIRNEYTSAPPQSAPDIGIGYAKLSKVGINTNTGLKTACSTYDYQILLSSYCSLNSGSAQQQVITYNTSGNVSSSGCGPFGCNNVSCPMGGGGGPINPPVGLPVVAGSCQIWGGITTAPTQSDPDVGTGYAKVIKLGISTMPEILASCSANDYQNLLVSYCASNSNPVQQEVVTYDTNGNISSSGCGPFGCDNVFCPTAVIGSCGTATQTIVPSAPTTNLCLTGTASAVSGTGPWNWTCAGSNGGTTASCSALKTSGGSAEISGVCMLRDGGTSGPSWYDPDVGPGYAKLNKAGINTISGLRAACSASDYSTLLTNYCALNSEPAQQQVITYGATGDGSGSACGPFGCESVLCPEAKLNTQRYIASIANAIARILLQIQALLRK